MDQLDSGRITARRWRSSVTALIGELAIRAGALDHGGAKRGASPA